MLIVGIDPSAKKIAIVATHRVLHVVSAQSFVLYKARERQTPESMGKALAAMQDFIKWADMVSPSGERYAWVEDPLVGRGGVATTMKQAYIGGIVRGSLVNAGFVVSGVHVSTWKKEVCGHGGASKPDVRRTVKIAWPKIDGLIGNDGDLADAAAINLYGQSVIAKRTAADAGAPTGVVQGGRPRTVVRPPRVRPRVR